MFFRLFFFLVTVFDLLRQVLALDVAFRQAESKFNMPSHLLKAIALTESGRSTPKGEFIPWPWTLNIEGEGKFFATKEEAIYALRQAIQNGKKSIDVGLMQINLYHHPTAFKNYDEALDPISNINYAAQFIDQLKKDTKNWRDAIARYHSAVPQHGHRYRNNVIKTWDKIKRGLFAITNEPYKNQLFNQSSARQRVINQGNPKPTWSLLSKIQVQKNPSLNSQHIRPPQPPKVIGHTIQPVKHQKVTPGDKQRMMSNSFFPLNKNQDNSRVLRVSAQKKFFPLHKARSL